MTFSGRGRSSPVAAIAVLRAAARVILCIPKTSPLLLPDGGPATSREVAGPPSGSNWSVDCFFEFVVEGDDSVAPALAAIDHGRFARLFVDEQIEVVSDELHSVQRLFDADR